MTKLTISEARQAGYTVDTTCYPHFAYKGPRFKPTDQCYCLTECEALLVSKLRELKREVPMPHWRMEEISELITEVCS